MVLLRPRLVAGDRRRRAGAAAGPRRRFGLLTWVVLRRIVAEDGRASPDHPRLRVAAPVVLAVVFLAWWLPQDMGVRPETVVCLCGAVVLYAVLVAERRKRLALAWLAFAVAGLGFAAHPTGLTLFAPLLAGLPLLWQVIAVPGDPVATGLRAFAVAAGGMVAPLLAFIDGGLRDFLRGQTLFLSIQAQENWTTEIQRYVFLLRRTRWATTPSAPRCCCAWWRWCGSPCWPWRPARAASLPTPLWLTGSTTALAFAALWLTPSKWTHHFGALAGVGSAFLALFLVLAVPTRAACSMHRLPVGVVAAAGVSFVVAIALGWHGPNDWPYAWLDGVRRPGSRPRSPASCWTARCYGCSCWWSSWCWCVGRAGHPRPATGRLRACRSSSSHRWRARRLHVGHVRAGRGAGRAAFVAVGAEPGRPDGEPCVAAGETEVLDPYTALPLPEAVGLPVPSPARVRPCGGNSPATVRRVSPASRVGQPVARDGGRPTRPWAGHRLVRPVGSRARATVTVLAAGS